MARTLPPMMQVMRDIGGVEFPERFVNLDGADSRKPEAKAPLDGNGDPHKTV
jgi:flotillin